MPQDGHGMPKATIQPQGAMPNAWWVPWPSGDGFSHNATPSTLKATTARTAQVMRSPRVAVTGAGAVGAWVATSTPAEADGLGGNEDGSTDIVIALVTQRTLL